MKSVFLLYIITFFLFTLISCSRQEKEFTIGYLQLTDDRALDEARMGVIESLKRAGFEEGKNIKISYKNAQGDIANIPLILQSFSYEGADLIITSTTPCMLGALQFVKNIPVVFTVAFSPEQVGIKNPPSNLTGVYDPIDMNEFLNIMNEIKPVSRLGIIFNSSETNAILGRDRLKSECLKQNITLEEAAITNSSEVFQAASSLAHKKVDAFAVATDNTVNSALESVVKVSLKSGIPIYDTEPSHVRKGALAGLGINNYTWGIESGKLAARIIKGEKPENIPMVKLTDKKLILNQSVAKKIGMSFPDNLIKIANEIIE